MHLSRWERTWSNSLIWHMTQRRGWGDVRDVKPPQKRGWFQSAGMPDNMEIISGMYIYIFMEVISDGEDE